MLSLKNVKGPGLLAHRYHNKKAH